MKSELSSVDVRLLVSELGERLVGVRLDKAYQVGGKELVLKLFGRGSSDLVVASNFMCVTNYKRPAPSKPSSFAMQLRKRLSGAYVTGFVQHGFDRIVEMRFDGYVLVFELFSKGNVILLDGGMKILGLLEWQKWKDRTLGVGKVYEYPPPAADPFTFDEAGFRGLFSSSTRGAAATLATRFSLGGYYAELVCAKAGVDPKALCADADAGAVWSAFKGFLDGLAGPFDFRLMDGDISPFGGEGRSMPSFNDAVDEYFSRRESAKASEAVDSKAKERHEKLAEVLQKQEAAYVRAKAGSQDERAKGDLIYQRMGEVQAVFSYVRDARRSGLPDEEILKGLESFGIVKGLRGVEVELDL